MHNVLFPLTVHFPILGGGSGVVGAGVVGAAVVVGIEVVVDLVVVVVDNVVIGLVEVVVDCVEVIVGCVVGAVIIFGSAESFVACPSLVEGKGIGSAFFTFNSDKIG